MKEALQFGALQGSTVRAFTLRRQQENSGQLVSGERRVQERYREVTNKNVNCFTILIKVLVVAPAS